MNIQIGEPVENKHSTMVGEVIAVNEGYGTLTVKVDGGEGVTDVWPIDDVIRLVAKRLDPLTESEFNVFSEIAKSVGGKIQKFEVDNESQHVLSVLIESNEAPVIGQSWYIDALLVKHFGADMYSWWWEGNTAKNDRPYSKFHFSRNA